MIKKFEEFINEYAGPWATTGFRYSKPTEIFTLSCNILVNPDSSTDIYNEIIKVLDEYQVDDSDVSLSKVEKDLWSLTFEFKAYSKMEASNISNEILNQISIRLENDIRIGVETIKLDSNMNIPETEISDYRSTKIGFKR